MCIVCRDLFVLPSTLMCGHTFCEECLHGWLKRQHTCPTCRSPVTHPGVPSVVLSNAVEKVRLRCLYQIGRVCADECVPQIVEHRLSETDREFRSERKSMWLAQKEKLVAQPPPAAPAATQRRRGGQTTIPTAARQSGATVASSGPLPLPAPPIVIDEGDGAADAAATARPARRRQQAGQPPPQPPPTLQQQQPPPQTAAAAADAGRVTVVRVQPQQQLRCAACFKPFSTSVALQDGADTYHVMCYSRKTNRVPDAADLAGRAALDAAATVELNSLLSVARLAVMRPR